MLENLIQSAKRRFFLNEALAQSVLAASVAVGGFAFLLIVGTALLGMWSLVVFAAAGIAIATYRLRQRTPDEYSTAVCVDRSQQLHDALSTAVYFSRQPAKAGTYRDAQLTQAEEAARYVVVENAAPFTFPRTVYALLALVLLSTGLAGLRYREGRLNLRTPLTSLFSEDAQSAAKKKAGGSDNAGKWLKEAQNLLSKLGGGSDPNQPLAENVDDAQNAMNRSLNDQKNLPDASQKGADDKSADDKKGADGDQNAAADPIAGDGADALNQDKGDNQAEAKNGKAGGAKVSERAATSKDESLMSKLKDALSTLMSSKDSPQQADSKNQQQDSQNDLAGADKSQGSQGQTGKDSDSSAAQSNDPNSERQRGDNAKLDAKDSSKTGEAGSGAGKDDGSKEIKQAELLKAMGKISELIGKRAADVSGETTVEVQSGPQQLKTAYSNTQASHGETDGDVTRDEIPVSLQSYVQQYFAQVRKSANSNNAKAKPADASQTKK